MTPYSVCLQVHYESQIANINSTIDTKLRDIDLLNLYQFLCDSIRIKNETVVLRNIKLLIIENLTNIYLKTYIIFIQTTQTENSKRKSPSTYELFYIKAEKPLSLEAVENLLPFAGNEKISKTFRDNLSIDLLLSLLGNSCEKKFTELYNSIPISEDKTNKFRLALEDALTEWSGLISLDTLLRLDPTFVDLFLISIQYKAEIDLISAYEIIKCSNMKDEDKTDRLNSFKNRLPLPQKIL